ncbi:AMP-binding protein [Flagellimonas chongwuensis]|nr:AMP-binding protein [Allomuricauda chongwuensis]
MMENPTWHKIHSDFQLNNVSYSTEGLAKFAQELKEGLPFQKSIGDFLLDWTSKESTVQVKTSGSTGKPKTIVLKKEHMVNSALATGTYFGLKPEQRALLCLPCTGIAGKMMLVRTMILGLHLDMVEPSSSPLNDTDNIYDFVAMVPLQVQNSMHQMDRVGQIIIGGAPVDSNLRNELSKLPVRAYETYGMTETITHIAVKKIDGKKVNPFETLPDVSVSQDDRGCLVIEAPKISDSNIITNDVVELINKNQFLWLGRYDSIINSGGIKIIPEKIEQKLSILIEPRFFVAGLPDDRLGEKLVLVMECEPMNKAGLLKAIKVLQGVSKYEVPKQVYFMKSFVETSTRKVDRKKTLEQIG